MFGETSSDPTLVARIAALEAQLAALTGTVGNNADAASDAVGSVAGDRSQGDGALLAALNEETAARERRIEDVFTQLGTEQQARIAGDAFATENGEFARDQGDYAKAQGDAIGDISDARDTAVAARVVSVNARDAAIAASDKIRVGPSAGLVPGTEDIIAAQVNGVDDRPVELMTRDGTRWMATWAGLWEIVPSLSRARDLIASVVIAFIGPSIGLIPMTTDLAAAATVDSDGRAVAVSSERGTPWIAARGGLFAVQPNDLGGPALGFVPGTTELAAAVSIDADGRPFLAKSGSTTWTVAADNVWRTVGPALMSGPSIGLVPGSTEIAATAALTADGRPVVIGTDTDMRQPTGAGTWVSATPIHRGPSIGLVPGTTEIAIAATIDPVDGKLGEVRGDGSETGIATVMIATDTGLVQAGAASGAASAEPSTTEFATAAITIAAGSIALEGDMTLAWSATGATSPATASDVGQVKAIAAGAATVTYLAYEQIVSVTSVTRDSDSAPMTLGLHYDIDMSRGMVTNLTASALTITYVGSRQRKDIVSINPNSGAITLTQGTEVARNAADYAPVTPAGDVEIGRVTRKGSRAIFIPRWRWRNGVHVDRVAAAQADLEYNRQVLAPIRDRLKRGLRVRFVLAGNSWAAMGAAGVYAKLNVNCNSHYDANSALRWGRDLPAGYFEQYDDATLGLYGLNAAARLAWGQNDVGYNQVADVADGFGAVHGRAGYVWAMEEVLHRNFPAVQIDHRNFGVPGTTSADTLNGNGSANMLYPDRWNAILADIVPGETVLIPVDPMNELGSTASYANWRRASIEAQAAGALVHFMGVARPDPRGGTAAASVALSARDMARAARDTGAAISDGWRILSPGNLCGLGLIDDEMMASNMINHGSVQLMREIGRDAAKSYL